MNNTQTKGWAEWNAKHKEKKLTPTLAYTLKLFEDKKTIPQIAQIREHKQDSIERQIVELITRSFIAAEDVITEKKLKQILNVITEKNKNSLKTLKELLPENITWFEIKCAIASLNAEPTRIE